MKKNLIRLIVLSMAVLFTQTDALAQKKTTTKKKITPVQKKAVTPKKIVVQKIPTKTKAETVVTAPKVEMVLVDINLHNFSVSETTRNRIDNNDCKRIFGSVEIEVWELNESNEKIKKLSSFNNNSTTEVLYSQKNTSSPPPIAVSHYQVTNPVQSDVLKTVTYNVPKDAYNNGKIMLIVKTQLGTRHKDNDFASYDFLSMEKVRSDNYILNSSTDNSISIKNNTAEEYSGRDLHINDVIIPVLSFQNTDDTHFIWTHISSKKK